MRRATQKTGAPGLSKCAECGEIKLPHIVCPECGKYRGRSVIVETEE